MTNLTSWAFLIFLGATLLLYYLVPKKVRWVIILIANSIFLFFSGVENFVFLIIVAGVTFFGALAAGELDDKIKKRLVLIPVIVIDLGTLLLLKKDLPGRGVLYSRQLVPLGATFYTLTAISYFMDVYNGALKAERNPLRFLTYLSFFPALVVGPINRYKDLGAALKKECTFNFDNIKSGILLFLFGAIKKCAISDLLYDKISPLFDRGYLNLPGGLVLLGALVFGLVLYTQLSGVLDMCRGVARLFEVELPNNFRQPYFSFSIGDFFRRWNITLIAFMKDYIFYPLALSGTFEWVRRLIAGKGNSAIRAHLAHSLTSGAANIITFLLVGLWCGRERRFALWGLYSGVLIALCDIFKPLFNKINKTIRGAGAVILTLIATTAGWYIMRFARLDMAILYIKRIFTDFGNPALYFSAGYLKSIYGTQDSAVSKIILAALSLIILIVASGKKEMGENLYCTIKKKNIALRFFSYYLSLLIIILSLYFSKGGAFIFL